MAHAAGDSVDIPIYGSHYCVVLPIFDADGDIVTGATGLDSEISKDLGTFADCVNEATELATASGIYYLYLTGAEMTAKIVTIQVKTTSSGAKTTVLTIYPTRMQVIATGTAQAGAAGTITLAASTSKQDNDLAGLYVRLSNDSPSGVQYATRKIISNVTSTQVATVESNWGTNPSSATTYELLMPMSVNPASYCGVLPTSIATAGIRDVNVKNIDNDAASASGTVTFPNATLASTTNITAGTITTTTNLTNLPAITSNWLTAAGLATDAVTEIRSLASGTSDSGTTTTMVDAARTEADTDYWKGSYIVFTSGNISGQARLITGFNASTDTITFAPATTQAVATQTYEIWPNAAVDVQQWLQTTVSTPTVAGVPNVNTKTWNDLATVALPLVPTIAGRTLDVSVGGEAGVDWANVGSPTTTVSLTGTTIAVTQKVDVETIKTNAVVNGGTITFPTNSTLASTTNITGGTITTVTNLTNAATSGDLTATMKASVNTEVDTALADIRLDELLAADSDIDGAAPPTVGSVFHELMTKTTGSFTFDQTTDSLEAIRDRGDAAWVTGTSVSAVDIATAVWQDATAGDFTVSGSIGKSLFTSGVVPGAAGGLFIAGTNAATTVTTSFTTTFTGNLTGSVGSVTGLTASNLDATISSRASSSEVTAIQNNTRAVIVVPDVIERPDTGTDTYLAHIYLYDTAGNMEAPDSAPTVTLVNSAATDRSSRLGSTTGTLIGTGHYSWTYTNTSTDDAEQLLWEFTVVEGGSTRVIGRQSLIVDTTAVDFTSTDRTALNAIKTKTDFLPSATAGASGGVFIAGTNAATTVTTAFTTTFTGNLTGSVASVTNPVLVSAGTGSGQLDFTSGVVKANATQILDTAISTPATAGILDVNIKRVNNVTASTPGASGGLLIAGSNAGTTTFAALTVTGTLTVSDGVVVSRSTSNGTGITVTGNGTGSGAIFNSGTGASGDALALVALSTNGSGMKLTGTGTGYDFNLTTPDTTLPGSGLTAAAIATGVWQDATAGDFTVSGSIGESLYTGVAPGATNGLIITGAGGFVECDVKAIDGSSTAAVIQKTIMNACYRGSVTSTGSTTTLIDTGLTQTQNDHWIGRVVLFTSGLLTYRATIITGFDSSLDKLTFTLIGGIPQIGDTYCII